jgi:RimJ/RimL family protein N-acetyltransferase
MTNALAALRPTTKRVRLEPLGLGDAAALHALTDDPAIAGVIDFLPNPFTLADAQDIIRRNDDDSECFFGVWRGDRLAGVVGAHLLGVERIEIGYWVGGAFQGMGLATEAAAAVIAAVQSKFPGRRIVAECRPDNLASWRVLEKLGFRPTGQIGARPGRQLLALG